MMGELSIWTIYDCPTDHPQGLIARRHEITRNGTQPTPETKTGTLHELRQWLAGKGLYCVHRDRSDDACIVESWI